MGSSISLRGNFDGERLRRVARQTKDAAQARRLLALASIYDGGSRSDAARLGSVTLQIVRDRVMSFNVHGPEGLINGKAPGPPSRLNDHQRAALAQAIERGPTPFLDGVVRWRLCDLVQWLWEEFSVGCARQMLWAPSRLPKGSSQGSSWSSSPLLLRYSGSHSPRLEVAVQQ